MVLQYIIGGLIAALSVALKRVVVHYALGGYLIRTEYASLLEHFVDKRGFAVIDVCDYRDVS